MDWKVKLANEKITEAEFKLEACQRFPDTYRERIILLKAKLEAWKKWKFELNKN